MAVNEWMYLESYHITLDSIMHVDASQTLRRSHFVLEKGAIECTRNECQ